ncbi:LytR/AlgR family response regulator transcription factor [Pedobacter xixiisoli]|nr:LytTR family transcriptional regulator DNA-binding domain-containing protein [Pedobacter xixiisoli]
MNKIRTMIIDDERSSRAELKRMLEVFPELELVGEAANADEAELLIHIQQPELLFLDIQMPERSGFELLQSLQQVPDVIFTTAFDQYAVKAFEVNALDYLLKPIRSERLALAIERIHSKLSTKQTADRVFVKDRDRYHFVSWDKIYLVESLDNYAKLFFDDQSVLFKSSLNKLQHKLDKRQFFRCNRAQLVNLNYIAQITNQSSNKLTILLKSGQKVELSERRSVEFRAINKI